MVARIIRSWRRVGFAVKLKQMIGIRHMSSLLTAGSPAHLNRRCAASSRRGRRTEGGAGRRMDRIYRAVINIAAVYRPSHIAACKLVIHLAKPSKVLPLHRVVIMLLHSCPVPNATIEIAVIEVGRRLVDSARCAMICTQIVGWAR